MADFLPARYPANALFDDERQPGLHRNTDDESAFGSEQAAEPAQHRIPVDDMLEHLHTEDGVVGTAMDGIVELIHEREFQARFGSITLPAVLHCVRPELRANPRRRPSTRHHRHGEEGAVAASVVQQTFTSEIAREVERHAEASTMAPGDQRRARKELLTRVMTPLDGAMQIAHSAASPHRATGPTHPPGRSRDRGTPSRAASSRARIAGLSPPAPTPRLDVLQPRGWLQPSRR